MLDALTLNFTMTILMFVYFVMSLIIFRTQIAISSRPLFKKELSVSISSLNLIKVE